MSLLGWTLAGLATAVALYAAAVIALVVALGLRIALRGASPAAIVRNWPGPQSSLRIILWLAGLGPPAKALR